MGFIDGLYSASYSIRRGIYGWWYSALLGSLKKKYISFLNFFFSVTRANETFALLRLTWEIMWQRCIEIYLSLLQGLKRDINLSHGTIMWQFQTEQCLCIMAIIFKINITSYKWTNMPMFALFPKWRRPCDSTSRCTHLHLLTRMRFTAMSFPPCSINKWISNWNMYLSIWERWTQHDHQRHSEVTSRVSVVVAVHTSMERTLNGCSFYTIIIIY